jgi:hypothetical protein
MKREGGAPPGTPRNTNTAGKKCNSVLESSEEPTDNGAMLDWALAYAKHEQRPVFPCDEKPGDHAKAPYTENGHLDATIDAKQICDWWIRWPDALIGSPVPSHLICFDLDPRAGGTVQAMTEAFGELPETEFVMSGRGDGGVHLFYKRPAGQITASRLKKVCPGVDVKLDTGYTILPPSLHPDTSSPYQWGGTQGHAQLPELVRAVLQPPARPFVPGSGRPHQRVLEAWLRNVVAERRTRNSLTFWTANRLIENGYPESAWTALAAAATSSGLPQSEIRKIFNSARKSAS